MEFKVGDRVKIKSGAYNHQGAEGHFGVILKSGELFWRWIVRVEFPGTQSDELGYNSDELELAPLAPAVADAAPGGEATRHTFVIELANRDPEDAYNQLLERLRAIDNQVPMAARLPGSPALIEQAEHLLKKYIELERDLAAARERIAALVGDLVAARNAVNAVLVHQSDEAARYEGELAAARSRIAVLMDAIEIIEGHLSAIQDYVFAPDASSVNAEGMTAEERMHGMVSQAMAAQDTINDVFEDAAKAAGADEGGRE